VWKKKLGADVMDLALYLDNARLHVNLDFFDSHQPSSTAMDSAKNTQINTAMDQLDSQDVFNHAAIGKKEEKPL
jgi:hypothetical protein